MVVVILAIVAVSFGINVLSTRTPPGVPAKLADMKLSNFVEGTQALTQVNQLHGVRIDLVNAYIAEYSHDFNPYHNDNARVTVWVGTARSSDVAGELLREMVEGISKGNTGFNNLQRLTIAGHEVFQIDGPGGEHFFYNSKEQRERVVWLTIEAANSLPIMEQALKNF